MAEDVNTYTPPDAGLVSAGDGVSSAVAAQAKAAVESRYIMAMRNPRDWDVVRQRLIRECQRPGFAASAIYHKPIGDGVEGASIRFVEAALRCMTNILPETFAIYDDPEKRIVRVSVTDLEANLTYTKDVTVTKTVERRFLKKGETPLKSRVNSKGATIFILEASDDDILNKENALISKAMRTLGLRILPGDIHDEGMAVCRKVRRDADAKNPDAAKLALFDAFAGLGVSADMLKEYLGHKAEVLNPKELEELRGLFSALRDGETSWREIIDAKKPPEGAPGDAGAAAPQPTAPSGAASLKDALKGTQAPSATAPVAQTDPPAPAAPAALAAEPPAAAPAPAAAAPAPDAAAPEAKPADTTGAPAAWLSDAQKKLLFAVGKKQNPVCGEAVVKHVIATLDGLGRDNGKVYFNALADNKPDALTLWAQARATIAAKTTAEAPAPAASTPPPPPPPPPAGADPDGF